jgi:hypothetical protein
MKILRLEEVTSIPPMRELTPEVKKNPLFNSRVGVI